MPRAVSPSNRGAIGQFPICGLWHASAPLFFLPSFAFSGLSGLFEETPDPREVRAPPSPVLFFVAPFFFSFVLMGARPRRNSVPPAQGLEPKSARL